MELRPVPLHARATSSKPALFNAVNFDWNVFAGENLTIAGIGLSVLWCPSDASVSVDAPADLTRYPGAPAGDWKQAYSSYGGVVGAWSLRLNVDNPTFALRKANMNGVIYAHSSTRLAGITDGTSNTLMFGEHAPRRSSTRPARPSTTLWNSGFWTDTLIDAYYPVNASHKLLKLSDPTGRDYIAMSLASFHPGGANVAFCDGSVRFLKESIDCWPIDPGTNVAIGVPFNADGTFRISIDPGAKVGVLQKIATRNFGDAVSAIPIEPLARGMTAQGRRPRRRVQNCGSFFQELEKLVELPLDLAKAVLLVGMLTCG